MRLFVSLLGNVPLADIRSISSVRKLNKPLPDRLRADVDERMKEIAEHLATIEADVTGMNRYR